MPPLQPHRYPDSNVFYRNLRRSYPLIDRAEGCWLVDTSGRRYLDATGGAMVVSVGHGVAEIAEAMAAQAKRVAYVNGTAFTSEPVERLASDLCQRSPAYGKSYFLGSGSEAVEAALKLARQHWVERKRPSKHKVIALTPSYHGNTLLALSASAREHYRILYREWLVDVVHIPAPYAYRCSCAGASGCRICSGDVLEEAIRREGSETVAAFIAEPVGGSSTGASVPRRGYFERIREICDAYDVLFVADEILCGAGRTGRWLALEHWGVNADIVTIGKALSGGYAPLSAILATEGVVAPIAEGSGAFVHAQTFSHHAVTCAGGVAALSYLDAHRLVERVAAMSPVLFEALAVLRDHPLVGDIRGRGLLAGIEFVADKSTRTPIPRAKRFAEHFTQAAQDAGLIVWPNVGHADGVNGDLVLIAPPFTIGSDEIAEIVSRFRTALDECRGETFTHRKS
ncbi:MAG: putative aminotransferase [Gemmatimonadaceae bacterium]|nr:putative aminotransferase [Gemmatimonadaceae bacterium]